VLLLSSTKGRIPMNIDVSKGGFDELAKFDARPTNYVTMAAHEIRSPLRSLRIHLETMKAEYGTRFDKKANELVNKSLHAVEQMQRLLEGILDCA
jgi:signal transduction histidine kinase